MSKKKMSSLDFSWQVIMDECGKSGYYMAAQFDYFMMCERIGLDALMTRLKTTKTGIVGLSRCGNPSPSEPGYFAKLEELCSIYGADVESLEKILRYGEKESPNTPANGGND